MADSKFLKFQDKNNDGMVDACDDMPITPAPKCPEGCLPNPAFMVPDWKNRSHDDPFLNEKITKYQITIRTKSTTTGATDEMTDVEVEKALTALYKEYEDTAIEWLLSIYNKDTSSVTEDKVREALEYTDFYLPPRPKSKLLLLYSIDCQTFNNLGEAGADDEEEDEEAEPVTYSVAGLREKISKVNKGLGLYNRYNKVYSFVEGGGLYYLEGPTAGAIFDLQRYGYKFWPDGTISYLRQLYRDLDWYLNGKGINLPGPGRLGGLFMDRATTIEFHFNKKYQLNKLIVYTDECGLIPKVFKKQKLKPLNGKNSWGDPTAVAYFAKLDDMIIDLEARDPMGWLEFVKKHTYPEIHSVVNAGYTNTDPEKSVGSCIANSLIDEGKQLGQDIFDAAFSLGDVIAAAFNNKNCYKTVEELREAKGMQGNEGLPPIPWEARRKNWMTNKELKELESAMGESGKEWVDNYKKIRQESKGEARQGFLKNFLSASRAQAWEEVEEMDPAILDMCLKVVMFLTAPKLMIHSAYAKSLGELKWCGLLELLAKTAQCLFKGLTLEEALGGILESALSSMSIRNFGKLVVGLPPEKQAELDALVKKNLKEGNIFKEGSLNQETSDAVAELAADPDSIEKPWNNEEVDQDNTSAKTSMGDIFSGQSYDSQDAKPRTLAQQFDGSSGDQLKTTVLLQAYVRALLEVYSENLLDLLDELNKFPGAPLVFQAIAMLDCPKEPLFNPNWMDFIKSLELPLCRNQKRISWPYMRWPSFKSWWLWLKEKVRALAEELWYELKRKILRILFMKLCELLASAACKALEVVGDAIEATFSQNTFGDLVRETFCGEDTPNEQLEDTIVELASTLGMGAAALADTEQTMNFFSDASSVASEREWAALFVGEPVPEAIGTIYDLSQDEYSEEFGEVFKSPEDVAALFKAVGNTMPTEHKRRLEASLLVPPEGARPANPSLCATPQKLEEWCQMRQDILEGRATTDQVAHMCEQGRQQNIDDLIEIGNLMNSTDGEDGLGEYIAANMPPLVSAPGCDNGMIPYEDEDMIATTHNVIGGSFEMLQDAFSEDMLGNGPGERNWGMINMIMADTMGNPLTVHNRKSNLQRKYVDFTIPQEKSPFFLNQDDELGFGNIPKTTRQRGAFPDKVAVWLQNKMGSLNIDFSSTNDKEGRESFRLEVENKYGGPAQLRLSDAISSVDVGYNVTYKADFENDTYMLIREPRKKTPDLTLIFKDNNEGLASLGDGQAPYAAGFKLKMYLSDLEEKDDQWRNVAGSNVRVEIFNLINLIGQLTTSIKAQAAMATDKEAMEALFDALKDGDYDIEEYRYEFMSFDENVFEGVDMSQYPQLDACFSGYQTSAPQLVLLKEMMSQNGATLGSANALKSTYDGIMQTITQKIFTDISENEAAFNYGAAFDDLSYDDVEYVVDSGQTNAPGGTEYAKATVTNDEGKDKDIRNSDQILGVSKMQWKIDNLGDTRTNRVFYLDPQQYGGNYMNPPLYIAPVENQGWMGFVDVLFPDMMACKPRYSDLIDFEDIQNKVNEGYETIPEDVRLKSDPDCVVELPYNRILERASVSCIQGIIMSAIRIYVSTAMIKSMATFTKFNPSFTDTFSSVYASYIVEVMEASFKDAQGAFWEGLTTFKDDEFWYAFLEQSVQMYARLVDSGDIEDPPEEVLRTLSELNDMQESFYEGYPDREDRRDAFWGGETRRLFLKQYREDLKYYAIFKTQDKAKRILKELVLQELNNMGKMIVGNLKIVGMSPDVHNLNFYLLQNLCQGGENLDVDKEVKEEIKNLPTEAAEEQYTSGGELYVLASEGDTLFEEGDEYKGYYYVKIADDGGPEWFAGEFEIEEEAQSSLAPFANQITLPIGDVSEYNTSVTINPARPFVIQKYISINGSKQSTTAALSTIKGNNPSLNMSDVYPGSMRLVKDVNGEEVGVVGEMGVRYGLEFSIMHGATKVPLATVEVDALDLPIAETDPLNGDSKLLYCLLLNLEKEEAFRLVTGYIFPLNKMTAMAAIYNDMGFLQSINQTAVSKDNWGSDEVSEHPGMNIMIYKEASSDEVSIIEGHGSTEGAWSHPANRDRGPFGVLGLFNLKYGEWDQELLRNSKSTIKRMFKTHYNMRDFDDGEDRMKSRGKIMIQQLKAVLKPAPGARLLPWWKKRMLRSNPFNKNGELCKK